MELENLWRNNCMEFEINKMLCNMDMDMYRFLYVDVKEILKSTRCFNNDIYSLPSTVDKSLYDMYPFLNSLSNESCIMSTHELEMLIRNIKSCNTSMIHKTNLKEDDEDIIMYEATPTMCNDDKGYYNNTNSLDTFEYYRNDNRLSNPITSLLPLSSRRSPKTNDTTCRSPFDINNNFNYADQFLSSFIPGNEYYNEYKTVETPTINNNNSNTNGLISPFSWEKNSMNYTPLNLQSGSNYLYKNLNSPINSLLHTDDAFNHTLSSTPMRPFNDYI